MLATRHCNRHHQHSKILCKMRHHGWELPYHPLQIVAVAVFFALLFAFYVFFIPFVGSKVLEILVIVSYSPTVVLVLVLYVWCVATNPADEGVLNSKKHAGFSTSKNKLPTSETSSRVNSKEGSSSEPQADRRLSSLHSTNQKTNQVHASNSVEEKRATSSFAWLSLHQVCTHKPNVDLSSTEDGMLQCSLCRVEVYKYSKHCRVCDKCVDGFDHHCRWLNNCVGKKNYKGFVILMASGLIMLILQWTVGLWVLVHFFINVRQFKSTIASKLGSSFPSIAYIIVVALCTILAMAATYLLAQLFCFHMLLIKKGISTYDYIVAMREQEQNASFPTSPASSAATTNSGARSAGVLQGRTWCTPPRIFFDNEQVVYPPESSLSMKETDPGISLKVSAQTNLKRKTPVKINPWALAPLNKEDVLHAATLARNKSSILRPVARVSKEITVAERSSSFGSSRDIGAEFIASLASRSNSRKEAESTNLSLVDQSLVMSSWQNGKVPVDSLERLDSSGDNSGNSDQHKERGKKVLHPLQVEARKVFKSSLVDQSLVMRSWQNGKLPLDSFEHLDSSEDNSGNLDQHKERGKKALNPLQVEARKVFKSSQAFSASGISVSSPDSSGASSEAQHSRADCLNVLEVPHTSIVQTDWLWTATTETVGHDVSESESADASKQAKNLPFTPKNRRILSDEC